MAGESKTRSDKKKTRNRESVLIAMKVSELVEKLGVDSTVMVGRRSLTKQLTRIEVSKLADR